MPIISIIVPIYNAQKYLRESLESIINQQCLDDIEVVLINDGSKDDSLSILREYETKYSFVKVIDKENEGVSATRNRGIEVATGDYIYFMDADDLLHPRFASIILDEIRVNQAEVIVWDFVAFYRKPKFCEITNENKSEKIDNAERKAFNYFMNLGCAVSLWNKVIRRSLVGEIIRLDISMTYGEDMFFSWKCLLLAHTVSYIHLPLYYYRQSAIGATARFHADLYEHYRHAFDDMVAFMKQQNIYSDDRQADVDYHFACRIPSLTNMESRAPYAKVQQQEHLLTVLNDEYIQRGLLDERKLNGEIYRLARQRNVSEMLKKARKNRIKSKILFPLKFILK